MARIGRSFPARAIIKTKIAGSASAYNIAADTVTFTLTGVATALTKQNKFAAALGAFTLAGNDIVLTRGRPMGVTAGSFTLTGIDAGLKSGRMTAPDVGAFTLAGVDAGLTYAAGAGSASLIIEDFESVVSSYVLIGWGFGGDDIIERVGFETQGTYAAKVTGTTFLALNSPVYPYSSVGSTASLDINIVSIQPDQEVRLALVDDDDNIIITQDVTTTGSAGSFTLTVDMTGLTLGHSFRFDVDHNGTPSGDFEIIIDNLRTNLSLLDGFEDWATFYTPNNISWQNFCSSGVIMSQSASHVTEGGYSYRLQMDDASGDFISLAGSYDLTLIDATSLMMDVSIIDMPADGRLFLWAFSNNAANGGDSDYIEIGTDAGDTGDFTLTLDVTSLVGPDPGDVPQVGFYVDSSMAEAVDIYVDTLVAIVPDTNTLAAAAGSFALTGKNIFLRQTYENLTPDTGTFTLAGNAAGLGRGARILGGAGSFLLTGNDAALSRTTRTLAAGLGSFSLTGNAAGLRKGSKTAGGLGTFILTGNDADLSRTTRTLTAGVGSFIITAPDAAIHRGAKIAAGTGSFTMTGNAASFNHILQLFAETGEFNTFGPPPHLITTGTVWQARSNRIDRLDVIF